MNKRQLNAILMVLILLIAVPFLPLLQHRNTEQLRYDRTEPDYYPGESGVESGVEDEKDWENKTDSEKENSLGEWADDLPSWLRELVEDPMQDYDGDGIPNIDDLDIDGDGIPNDEEASDEDIVKPNKKSFDTVTIDNFYNGEDGDELDQVMFRVSPIEPAKYWKVRSLDRYDPGFGGGHRWSSSLGTPDQTPPYEPLVTSYSQRNTQDYDLIFEGTSNPDDYLPTAQNTRSIYNINPGLAEDSVRVNELGDFYSSEALKSYSFSLYEYEYPAQSFYAFSLDSEEQSTLNDELRVADYYREAGRKEHNVSLLADSIVRGQENQFNSSMAIVAYLKSSYTYGFKTEPVPVDEDPVYWFLFREKQGTCIHFATAFVQLARLAGIPARLAVGFAIGTVEGEARVVKANNAHAWGEVYFGELGWLPFEATSSIVTGGNSGGENEGVDPTVHGGGDGGGSTSGDMADTDEDDLSDANELLLGTDPLSNDTDRDGLGDGEEVKYHKTNPLSNDTDNDGLGDFEELNQLLTSPLDMDSDEDGITDWNETRGFTFRLGTENDYEWVSVTTNPIVWDSDGDGLHDGLELGLTMPQSNETLVDSTSEYYFYPDSDPSTTTHPLWWDTDGDNLSDGDEDGNKNGRYDPPSQSRAYTGETDPGNPDTDGGGAWDGTEKDGGGDPSSNEDDARFIDSDEDGLYDADEILGWYVTIINSTGDEVSYHVTSDPLLEDTDNDRVSDLEEYLGYLGQPTDPRKNDTDGDGLWDVNEEWDVVVAKKGGEETRHIHSNPLHYNSDTDGLNDYEEWILGTNPKSNDTDGDNPEGLYILDDHLDKHPTVAAYEYVDTSLDIQSNRIQVWKVTEEIRITGVLSGTKLNDEGEPVEVIPGGVHVVLFLGPVATMPRDIPISQRITLISMESDSAGEFVFNTNLESVPMGFYTLWGEVLTTYGEREQFNPSVSNTINISVSSESRLTLSSPGSVADESNLQATGRLLDQGGLPVPWPGLNLSFSWDNGKHIEDLEMNKYGRAFFTYPIDELTGQSYNLRVGFQGHQESYFLSGEDSLRSEITLGSEERDIKVLSNKLWLNASAPWLVSVNESFLVTGNISAQDESGPVDLSEEPILVRKHGTVIGTTVVEANGSFTVSCSFDPEETNAGEETIMVSYPGSPLLAERWEYLQLNIGGTSRLQVDVQEVLERPGTLPITGQLLDNQGSAIKGARVELVCRGVAGNDTLTLTGEDGKFAFLVDIPVDHSLGEIPVTVRYLGFGYLGEDDDNKLSNVTNYYSSSWSGMATIIATVELFVEEKELVRAEDNILRLWMNSYGNNSVVAGQSLYFFFDGQLVGNLTTDSQGQVLAELPLPVEQRAGYATISLEFQGTPFVKAGETSVTLEVFTRTQILMEDAAYFRPLEGNRDISISGQVENASLPRRSITLDLYLSRDTFEAPRLLAAYQEHGQGRENPFIDPFATGQLSFPDDLVYIGSESVDQYGNFSRTVSIQEKAGTGRFFFYTLFNGTQFYYPSSRLTHIDIRANSSLLVGSSTTAIIGKEMSLSFTLLDDLVAPLPDKEVFLYSLPPATLGLPGEEMPLFLDSAVSDSNGTLHFKPSIDRDLTRGDQSFQLIFPGDLFYASSNYEYPVTLFMESRVELSFLDASNRTVLTRQQLEEEERQRESGEWNKSLALKGKSSIQEGDVLRCRVQLLDLFGEPIAYKKVDIHLNGAFYKSVYLDDNASFLFSVTVNRGLSGYFIVQVVYKGGPEVLGNSSRMDIGVSQVEEQGFFSSAEGLASMGGILLFAIMGGFFLWKRNQDEEALPTLSPEEMQESNRKVIIKEYNRFVEFMRYYGFDIAPGRTAREIISESDRNILMKKEDFQRITAIFERARYRIPDGKSVEDDWEEEWPGEDDVEEIQNLIRKIEDDIEVENIPLFTGEPKRTDGLFDTAKNIKEKLVGVVNGKP